MDIVLPHPIRDINLYEKFQKIDHLRDTDKYPFNANGEIDYQKEDLINILLELRHSISRVYEYYEIGLTQPVASSLYSPTADDMLFFYYVDDSFMRLYSAWNRIANLLSWLFRITKRGEKVYFDRTIEKLRKIVGEDDAFKRLLAYKDGDYKDIINRRRKEVVHNITSWSTYFKQIVESHSDEEAIRELTDDRNSIPGFLGESYKSLVEGIYRVLDLVSMHVGDHELEVCMAAAAVLRKKENKEYVLEERPDKVERSNKAIDSIFRCGKERIALEHTFLESYPSQTEYDLRFNEFVLPLQKQLEGKMPPGRYTISFYPEDIVKIEKAKKEDCRKALLKWIVDNAQVLSKADTPGARGNAIREYPVGIPFEVIMQHWARRGSKVWFARHCPRSLNEESRERLITAIAKKCPKLADEKGDNTKTVLVLEKNDIALGNREEIMKMVKGEIPLLGENAPDAVVLVEIEEDDEWLVSLLMEGGKYMSEDDYPFIYYPNKGDVTDWWA